MLILIEFLLYKLKVQSRIQRIRELTKSVISKKCFEDKAGDILKSQIIDSNLIIK